MSIDEVCPQCGAERVRWDGGSHRHHDWVNERYDALLCDDGRSPEQAWRTIRFSNFMSPAPGITP